MPEKLLSSQQIGELHERLARYRAEHPEMLPTKQEVMAALPSRLPHGWRYERLLGDGAHFMGFGMSVIVTVAREEDNRLWLHVSTARPARLPDWEDLKRVREAFCRPNLTALQVFPPASSYVNLHPFCLYLWQCIDGDVTPDFSHGTGLV